MEYGEIRSILINSIDSLMSEDIYLIINNINERSIAHHLAKYLESNILGMGFNVDCEYNGDINNGRRRKYINLLRKKAEELGLISHETTDEEIIEREIFPDIIIHKRGSNVPGSNLLVIELKKSTNSQPIDWDVEKIRCIKRSMAITKNGVWRSPKTGYGDHLKRSMPIT
jgi:hypothetical protein